MSGMTVEDLRLALKDLPGELEVVIAYPDLQNPRLQYETRDVRVVQVPATENLQPCLTLEAWGGS
ncbi:Uncharacterised protein [Achromobacter xylosoxidans]|nr:hypothetical protein LMG1866_04625 [Achromobacter ruhlandii]CAB3920194.1 hypothetical protein LMG26846_05539 [Achromobacter insuavis]CUJ32255.1 Uncharacterised protein [Achromobacter xylosoxidans]CUJ40841.1 Uncharacterised protein [Achromobacter sp. 2789STDY5608621]